MIHIRTDQVFEGGNMKLREDQKDFLNKYVSGTWGLNTDGLVDVNGDFDCSNMNYKNFLGVKFGKVSGDFSCFGNQLTSLKGAPIHVGVGFYCAHNKLTSLQGSPINVGVGFYCAHNKLTSLQGSPINVGGDFTCYNNQLTTLEGAPESVGKSFDCSYNKLTSLGGAPKSVGVSFFCEKNKLTTLEGSPRQVIGYFHCYNNQLTSLEGAPESVGESFDVQQNPLITLEGAPLVIGDKFFCDNFIIQEGRWGPEDWVNLSLEGSKLALTLLKKPENQKKITDQVNLELKKKGNFEKWESIFKFPWYKPTPFVEALYKTWKKGL
jgi:hypothetical protein